MRYEDRFTSQAKEALSSAQELASKLGHSYIGSEHILYGLSCEGPSVASKVLSDFGITPEYIVQAIESLSGRGEGGSMSPQGLSPRAKRIIELAVTEAARLGHNDVGTEHLLAAILHEDDSAACYLLTQLGVSVPLLMTNVAWNSYCATAGVKLTNREPPVKPSHP